jgi:hypothetical protein
VSWGDRSVALVVDVQVAVAVGAPFKPAGGIFVLFN